MSNTITATIYSFQGNPDFTGPSGVQMGFPVENIVIRDLPTPITFQGVDCYSTIEVISEGEPFPTYFAVETATQLISDANLDTGAAPHNFGYSNVHKDGEYATAQTGTALWTPASGKKFVVTDITITTGGTTAGIVTLWQGAVADTTYTIGTDPAVFRGEFAPSANSKPGVVKSFNVPYVSTTVDHILRVTTSSAMTVYVQCNGYEI